jgi:hypothetical protein
MSEYVVHFTKDAFPDSNAYSVMMNILWERRINPSGPFGAARHLPVLGDSQRAACFSEIPLDLLVRLIDRRSLYGIGFSQDVVIARGGGRVWYLDRSSRAARAFRAMVDNASSDPVNVVAPIWRLTPFVDYPGAYGATQYRFEWEREWRVPGGLAFDVEDVAFLFLPEEHHARARTFFEEVYRDNDGPAYLCPYIDPRWGMERIQSAFANVERAAEEATPTFTPVAPEEGMCDYCGGSTLGGICLDCGMQVG